jgi:hypothetical protein
LAASAVYLEPPSLRVETLLGQLARRARRFDALRVHVDLPATGRREGGR